MSDRPTHPPPILAWLYRAWLAQDGTLNATLTWPGSVDLCVPTDVVVLHPSEYARLKIAAGEQSSLVQSPKRPRAHS